MCIELSHVTVTNHYVMSYDPQVIKGSDPIEIRTPPVVQVSLDLSVSLDDFFESEHFVQYLALVLQIDITMIRVVDVVSEDTV